MMRIRRTRWCESSRSHAVFAGLQRQFVRLPVTRR
jgi:hypothetical protein